MGESFEAVSTTSSRLEGRGAGQYICGVVEVASARLRVQEPVAAGSRNAHVVLFPERGEAEADWVRPSPAGRPVEAVPAVERRPEAGAR